MQWATDDREWALSGLPVGAGWALSGRLLLIRVKYIIRCVDFESTQILYSAAVVKIYSSLGLQIFHRI